MTANGAENDARHDANQRAVRLIDAADPVLTGIVRAGEALGLGEGELGHAGPPFQNAEVIPRPVMSALAGAVLHEGWAATLEAAERLILDSKVKLYPNHDLGTVSPMAGVVRPSQIVVRVENRAGAGVAFATLAEAGRQVLRFGVYNQTVAAGLRWLDEILAPALARALPTKGLPVKPLLADAVSLGDDAHQRNIGGMAAFTRALPSLDNDVRAWLLANPQHFLNYAMASAKLALDRAGGVAGSSIVTAIARNGVECGVRVAGAGKRWFTAPATIPRGVLFAPFAGADAQPDLGDSAIMEAYGLGAAIAHAAPELARTIGRNWPDATTAGHRMRRLFFDTHSSMEPMLAGAPGVGLGLDARYVVDINEPVDIHTGIAHRDGSTGWIGLGVASAPVSCFAQAIAALRDAKAKSSSP
jgi:Protein of unknown function (DUF1116)